MNTWGFLALLSVPAILIMYFFKQKYKEKEVSSSFLWDKVFLNTMSQKPWQKLRKNILLILQIIIAILISISLINPLIKGLSKSGNYCLVIDNSLSMATLENDKTRLQTAKDEIINFLGDNENISEMTVISYSNEPTVLLSDAESISEVKNSVNSVKQTYSGADTEMLKSLLNTVKENTNIVVFTDTFFESDIPNIRFMIMGDKNKEYENISLTQISHKINENDITTLINVKNYGISKNVEVSLYADDVIYDVKSLDINSGEEKTLDFSGIDKNTKLLTAKISEEDDLKEDNIIYDTINDNSEIKTVLVSDGNVFTEKMVSILNNVSLIKAEKDNINTLKGFDFYIFDGTTPDTLPDDGNILIINPDKSNDIYTISETVPQEKGIVSTDIFDNIKNVDFSIKEYKKANFVKGFNPVIKTGEDSLVSVGKYKNNKAAVFTFDLHNSDLPLKKEFPLIMYEIYMYFTNEKLQGFDNVICGDYVNTFISSETEKINITTPLGEVYEVLPNELFNNTMENGFYNISAKLYNGETKELKFAANVDTSDSDINIKVTDANKDFIITESLAMKELQNLFLILALIVLIVEWWVNYRYEH